MGWVKCTSWAQVVLLACVSVPVAANAEWDVTGSVGETVTANDNQQLEADSRGGAVGSITNLSLQAINEWPTLRWAIGTDLGFSQFWGPGANDSLDGLHGGVLTTSLDKAAPLTDYHASFSASVLPASVSEVLDSGVTNADTTTFTYAGQGSLTHQLNELNAIGLSVSGRSQSFSNDGSRGSTPDDVLTPNTYLTAGQSWIRALSPRTNLTLAANTGGYIADGAGTTDQVSESVTLQVQTELSERLNFTAGGGANVVRTSGITDETTSGFVGDVAIAYELVNASVSAFAAHNLAPSSLGSLQERTSAGFNVAHQINEASSVVLTGAFVYQLPVTSIAITSDRDQQHQALVLSVGYRRMLAENWNLGLSYAFTQQNNSDDGFFGVLNEGSSTSNAVFATITRNFSLWSRPLTDIEPDLAR
jgi:hypothetical protein